MIKPHRKSRSTNYAGTSAVSLGTSQQNTPFDRKPRVLDIANTDQCAHALLDFRVSQVNATGRYDNAIYCSDGEFVELLRKKGHTIYVIKNPRNLSPIKMAICIWKTTCLLRKHRFDIIHTHTSVPGLFGRIAGFLARTEIVIHQVHGYAFHDNMNPILKWLMILAERFLSLLADRILFQNQQEINECLRRKIAPSDKLIFIGNGIQLERFRVAQTSEHNVPIIFCTARLEPVKNHMMLLKAVRILKDRNVRFVLQLAGDGSLRTRYEKWVHEQGLEKEVIFLGYRNDVRNLIANSDVCVLSSEVEGIPRSIMEAAAAGKPMVATDVVGNRDALVNGRTGFLVLLNDSVALADRIENLISDADLRCRIGRQAREYAEQNFNEKKVVELIIKIYDEELRKRQTEHAN
jgi:glycosyltransferase involved in cell wall biosynthesis